MVKEFQGEYRWLSNFAPVEVEYRGEVYPSVEHAYMGAKSDDPEWKEYCQDSSNTPGNVKKASKSVKLVEGWDGRKLEVMKELIALKFSQEPYKSKLIDTGLMLLQEGNRWGDRYWGIDLRSNIGENKLGKLIMAFRASLYLNKQA